MADEVKEILRMLGTGRLPAQVPVEIPYSREIKNIVDYLAGIQKFTEALASGELTKTPTVEGGAIISHLKSLQTNLQHLSRQSQRTGEVDLSKQADMMGHFTAAFNEIVKKLDGLMADLRQLSLLDPLTDLYNRAYFEAELERATRGRRFPLTIVMADVDGLKAVNYDRGHKVGDALIRTAGRVLRQAFRAEDVVARIGGDEFAAILFRVDSPAAERMLARVRTLEKKANLEMDVLVQVSVSLGAASAHSGAEVLKALKAADDRMCAEQARKKL